MDLGNPDDEVRKNAVDTFKKCLKFNQILGASIVGTETAYPRLSREEKQIWHPYMMDSIARLVEEAERLDVDMAIEPVYVWMWIWPSNRSTGIRWRIWRQR